MDLETSLRNLIDHALSEGLASSASNALGQLRVALDRLERAMPGVQRAPVALNGNDLLVTIFRSTVSYAIIISDLQGDVVAWNAGAVRLLGWTFEEMEGHPVDMFFTPEDRAKGAPHLEMLTALEKGQAADERWHIKKSGERFWGSGEMMPLIDDDSRVIGFIKIIREGVPWAGPGN